MVEAGKLEVGRGSRLEVEVEASGLGRSQGPEVEAEGKGCRFEA